MKFIGSEKGAAAIEAAIIMMLLLTLIFGIIETGLLLFDQQMLTNASREGARAGVVVGLGRSGGQAAEYLSESTNVASNFCSTHLVSFGAQNLNVTATSNDVDGSGGPTRGDDLRVSLSYNYDFLMLSALGIGPVTLNAVSTMKLE